MWWDRSFFLERTVLLVVFILLGYLLSSKKTEPQPKDDVRTKITLVAGLIAIMAGLGFSYYALAVEGAVLRERITFTLILGSAAIISSIVSIIFALKVVRRKPIVFLWNVPIIWFFIFGPGYLIFLLYIFSPLM